MKCCLHGDQSQNPWHPDQPLPGQYNRRVHLQDFHMNIIILLEYSERHSELSPPSGERAWGVEGREGMGGGGEGGMGGWRGERAWGV